mmetsp:Transcript_106843/g.302153  ORF Transcript_106843/g.302153 Transcript_106843/m.302153 type:complete len:200 (-) Transcript_106843:316-915(-)
MACGASTPVRCRASATRARRRSEAGMPSLANAQATLLRCRGSKARSRAAALRWRPRHSSGLRRPSLAIAQTRLDSSRALKRPAPEAAALASSDTPSSLCSNDASAQSSCESSTLAGGVATASAVARRSKATWHSFSFASAQQLRARSPAVVLGADDSTEAHSATKAAEPGPASRADATMTLDNSPGPSRRRCAAANNSL